MRLRRACSVIMAPTMEQGREPFAAPLDSRTCCCACREVEKAVRSRKARSVIMAPNIDQDEEESRLDGLLDKLLRQAGEYGIPVIHALTRKKLGQACLTCCSRSRVYTLLKGTYSPSLDGTRVRPACCHSSGII